MYKNEIKKASQTSTRHEYNIQKDHKHIKMEARRSIQGIVLNMCTTMLKKNILKIPDCLELQRGQVVTRKNNKKKNNIEKKKGTY